MNNNKCEGCGSNKTMVPLQMAELHSAAQERTIKRLWITVLVLIGLLCATNLGWLIYESQFEEVTTTEIEARQETTDGGNNYVVGGDFDYGKTDSTSETDYDAET